MKQKRFWGWMVAGLLTFGFSSCTDDSDITGNEENGKQAKAYIGLTISVPNDVTDSRATADGYGENDTYEKGTENEYKVNNIQLFLYPVETGNTFQNIYFTNPDIKAGNAPAGDENSTYDSNLTYYYAQGKVSPGKYRAYVLVNAGELESDEMPANEIGLQNLTLNLENTDGLTNFSLSESNGIVMSGRNVKPVANDTSHPLYQEITLKAETNTEDQPYQLTMTVERAWAKVSIANASQSSFNKVKDNTNTGDENYIASVTLEGCTLFNLSNTYYAFRHVGGTNYTAPTNPVDSRVTFGKVSAETTNNYVIDPQTTQKTVNDGKYATLTPILYSPTYDENLNWKSASPTTSGEGTDQSETTSTLIGYCLENTTFATASNQQYKGYATGVTFKAKITPNEGRYYTLDSNEENAITGTYTAGNDLYYYNNNFYENVDALKKHVGGVISTLTDINESETTRKAYNIYKYTGGICYYSTFIRHQDNKNAKETGVMEFAIVRNNHYYLNVTDVALPGDEEPGIPTEPEPIESGETYIRVNLQIAPWIVRENNITLGQ